MPEDDDQGPIGYPFAVADRLFCCWGWDHEKRTLEYLEGIDPRYFETLAALYVDQLESEDAGATSMALRVLYHQGIETLMSLLGAAAQGVAVVPAWIAKCATNDLQEVVGRLQYGRPLLTENGTRRMTFDDLARTLHRNAWAHETGDTSTAERFGRLWHRLSTDFLDDTARAEYNALKHGTRVLPGGFTLAIGTEDTYGVPAPPERMQSLGGSRFGSTFFAVEAVGSTKWNIQTRRTSINWLPIPLALRLGLISMSINNVVSALRCQLGIDPTTLTFRRPLPIEAFDEAWSQTPGVTSTNMDYQVRLDATDEPSRDTLRDFLENRASSTRRVEPESS